MRLDLPRSRVESIKETLTRGGDAWDIWVQTLTDAERYHLGGLVSAVMKALTRPTDPAEDAPIHVEIGSILSARTHEGMVEFRLDDHDLQMDLAKAREVVGMLQGAIEAAVSDELLFRFLMAKIGLSQQAAGAALIDFREMRQGTRGTSWPH